MSKKNIVIPAHVALKRLSEGANQAYHMTYKNPFLLAYLYYTEGMSTVEIAEMLDCEQRTIRRYMNYYGFKRFTKKFSLLVKHHGIEGALKLQAPEFYPLGVHND
ncbi:helix-turn-helix domain-containing protein [Heyndrickxia sporothermodurans]|uniref:helix-turn-helix domain-containing protein n=1 Tax=Heyndrickxia sporothermodurans TaxID=46224 RepID=UPI00192AF0C8|nr:helix-turn-helix domain-containing protein [Heyndrickxia sporothermodurans]